MCKNYFKNMIKIEKNKIALVGFPEAIFIKDMINQIPHDQYDISVICPDDFFNLTKSKHDGYMICVTRDMQLRARLVEHFVQQDLPGFSFVHTSAVIFPDVVVGGGCFVGPFAFIASQAQVEDHCLINPYVMVSHRCTISQGSILQPGTMIAGSTKIGRYCKLNFKSATLDDISIANFTEVGANSLVTKTIEEEHGVYVGTPARRVKHNTPE